MHGKEIAVLAFDTSVDEYTLVESVRTFIVGDQVDLKKSDNPDARARSIEIIKQYGGGLKVDLSNLSDYVMALVAIDIVRQHAVTDTPSIILAIASAKQAEIQLEELFGASAVQSVLCETVQKKKTSLKKKDNNPDRKPTKVDFARELYHNNPNITPNEAVEILMQELSISIGYARAMWYNVKSETKGVGNGE